MASLGYLDTEGKVFQLKDIPSGTTRKKKKEEVPEITAVQPTVETVKPTVNVNNDGYEDTGKKYGDYNYQDYINKKDYKIYKKDGKSYYYDEKRKQYVDMDAPTMTSAEQDKKDYEEAVKNGFVDKTYKTNKVNKLAKREFDSNNVNNKFGLQQEETKEQVLPTKISEQIALDTSGLTKEEKKKYAKSLIRQEKQRDKELSYVRTGGAGLSGAFGELQNIGRNVEKDVIDPLLRIPSSYEYGQLSRDLSEEYYKKMMGKKNKVSEIENKINQYNLFNADVVNSQNQLDTYFKNLPNQVGGIVSGVENAGILGGIGAIGGGLVGGLTTKTPTGALVGAEKGAKWLGGAGYVKGQAENTFKLEAGAEYQTLLEMGVPEDIARKEALRVGTENALIESGESILDLITLGKAGAATDALKEGLLKKYGPELLKSWGISYGANIASEGAQESLQEQRSIAGEKRATKKAGIERDDSKDTKRILESGLSGAFSAAISGGATKALGVTGNTTKNQLINEAKTRTTEKTQKTPQIAQNQQESTNIQETTQTEPISQETTQIEEVKEQPRRIVGKRDYSSPKFNNLSDDDLKLLDNLYMKDKNKEEYTQEDKNTLDYLKKKAEGIKNPEININIKDFKDIQKDYIKYGKNADLENFDTTMTQKAKEIIQGNKQGRRTKQEWLDVAKNIGMQAEKLDSEALKKYAYESFMYEKPNQKQNLNRQGQKYVSFGAQDWVKAVYEGAGVGKKLQQPTQTTKNLQNISNTVQKIKNRQIEDNKIIDKYSTMNQQEKNRAKMAISYEANREIREAIQGNSFEKIEGGLTEKELKKKIEREKSNYIGKEVIVNGQKAKIIGTPSFGNYPVKLENGEIINVKKDTIESVQKIEEKQPKKTYTFSVDDLTKENIPEEKAKEPVLKVETKGEKGKQFFEEKGASPEVAKILSETPRKEKPTFKEKIKGKIDNINKSIKEIRRSFVDKGQEIADIDKKTGKKGKLYANYDFLALSESNAQYQIGENQTDSKGNAYKNFIDKNGNKIPMSLEGIWKDIDDRGYGKVMDEYLAHTLNTDVYGKPTASSQREVDATLNMVEAGFISPEEAKSIIDSNQKIQNVFGESITKKDSLKRIAEIEKEYPGIEKAAQNVWQYGYNELDKMVDSGRVSKSDAEKFKQENPHYVRLQRNIEQKTKSQDIFDLNKTPDLSVKSGIQERKGGTQDILPFRDTMADYTRFNAKQSRLNNFGLKLAEALNTTLDVNDKLATADKENITLGDTIKKNDDGTYTFRIYKDGKPKQIYINEGIYEALQPNKKYKYEDWTPFKISSKISKIQRDLITGKNLLFSTTNAPKDFFNALFNTKNSTPQFSKNYFKAIPELFVNGEKAQQYKALGGNQNTYYNYEEGYIKNKSKIKALKTGQAIINGIERINNFVETLPRLAEFMSSIENGKSVEEAMYDAAEVTTNFKRGGNIAKSIDRVGANYFNPSVQGASKFVRNFGESIANKQYAKILTRVALMGLAPALVGEIMWGDDDDYKDLPEYQKDNYFLWKTGEGKWIRIPKGQVQGALQALPRRMIASSKGQKDAYSGLTDTFLNNVAPNNPLADNVFGPILSVASNKSWSGNPIVPSYKENKKHPEVEYTSGTDEFSKWLGKKLGKSPAKINYLLDQYTGGLGDIFLPNITNKTTQEDNSIKGKLLNPLKSKFTTDTTYSSKAQGAFYDALEEAKNDNDKRWEGRTDADSVRYKYLYSKNLELADINKQIEEIQSSNIDKDEKYKKVTKLRKKLNEEARKAVENSQNIKEKQYYMQIDDSYYYKYQEKDGSITYKKATDKQVEKNKYALADYFRERYKKSTER